MKKSLSLFLLYPLFLLLICLSPYRSLADEPAPYTVVEDLSKTPLLGTDFSGRKVLKLRLENGLEAYLVSDPKIDKSGAVLTVNVGSWNEPPEYPGLAHFLEHMLFLGTKRYPKESGYAHFIAEHGGNYNAYTTNTITSYLFTVNNSDFEEALDRFSDFFVAPLFNPSGVSRELQAIDQEYAKNLENDDIRLFYVNKALANPDHPYHGFSMGNSETLSKASQDILKTFYEDHYSANLMHLIVYSALPMDQLKELVVKEFQPIQNKNKQPYHGDYPLFKEDQGPSFVYIEPVKNRRTLALLWEIPAAITDLRDSQPDRVVCYVLGHEGKESLLAQLKRENLAESLKCGTYDLSEHQNELLLEIELTETGLKQVDYVIERCFQAIAYLRLNGISRAVFDEIQRMSTINYQYQSREDLFQVLMKQSDELVKEDLKTYPEQTQIPQKFDPDAIQALLKLMTPQRAHYYVMAPATLTEKSYDQHDKWIGTAYTVKPIDREVIEKWSEAKPHPDITLPAQNPYIPQQLSVLAKVKSNPSKDQQIPVPEVIQDTDRGVVYYAQDTRYLMPNVRWSFDIKTPQVDMGSAVKTVLADLYVKSATEALTGHSYAASQAGLNFKIQRSYYGISLVIEGYSDHADLLLQEIVKSLKKIEPTEQQFELYKETLQRQYQNFSKKLPIEQAFELLKSVIYKKFVTEKQKSAAINRITFEKFNEYKDRLFNQIYVEGMLYGNMSKKQAQDASTTLQESLQSLPYSQGKDKRPEVIMLPEATGPFYWEANTKAQGNAAILTIEFPYFDFKARAMQQILTQAMSQSFFSALRTKQQTGYMVYNENQELEKHLFNLFAVQSNTHAVRDLLARYELFIEGYMQELPQELTEERFERNKQAVLTVLEQPPKNINEMGELLHRLAFTYDGDFGWMTKRIQGVKELTYPEFLSMSDTFMGRQNKRRLAVLMKGTVPKEVEFKYAPINNLNSIRKLGLYGPVTIQK